MPRRGVIAACTVLVAVGVLTGAVRAAQGPLEARLPSGVTISR